MACAGLPDPAPALDVRLRPAVLSPLPAAAPRHTVVVRAVPEHRPAGGSAAGLDGPQRDAPRPRVRRRPGSPSPAGDDGRSGHRALRGDAGRAHRARSLPARERGHPPGRQRLGPHPPAVASRAASPPDRPVPRAHRALQGRRGARVGRGDAAGRSSDTDQRPLRRPRPARPAGRRRRGPRRRRAALSRPRPRGRPAHPVRIRGLLRVPVSQGHHEQQRPAGDGGRPAGHRPGPPGVRRAARRGADPVPTWRRRPAGGVERGGGVAR